MTIKLFLTLATGLSIVTVQAQANEVALALAKKNNCAACHAVDQKLVGPSWRSIGQKYAGDTGAEARLVLKAKKGGVGVWGQIPMPPNVTAKDADLKAIVQYALSLK
ncbi:MAG: c-type cytochrome [Aquabacterium commune]|uniref:c-type cytochrome n=1 Tax=Aquabacterium commune TaxID=70586 RepID=UPI003BB16DC8